MVMTVAVVRQQLANLANSGGSHKDQAEKYDFVFILHNQSLMSITFYLT